MPGSSSYVPCNERSLWILQCSWKILALCSTNTGANCTHCPCKVFGVPLGTWCTDFQKLLEETQHFWALKKNDTCHMWYTNIASLLALDYIVFLGIFYNWPQLLKHLVPSCLCHMFSVSWKHHCLPKLLDASLDSCWVHWMFLFAGMPLPCSNSVAHCSPILGGPKLWRGFGIQRLSLKPTTRLPFL